MWDRDPAPLHRMLELSVTTHAVDFAPAICREGFDDIAAVHEEKTTPWCVSIHNNRRRCKGATSRTRISCAPRGLRSQAAEARESCLKYGITSRAKISVLLVTSSCGKVPNCMVASR